MKTSSIPFGSGLMAVLALLLSTSAIAGGSEENANGNPIKIGSLVPLGTTQTGMGRELSRGAEVMVSLINDQGGVLGRNVVIVSRGEESAEGAAARLIQRDRVVGLLGPSGSASALAIGELLRDAKIPAVLYSGGSARLTTETSQYFRSVGTFDYYYYALVSYLHTKRGFRRFAFVGVDHDEGLSALNGVIEATRTFFDAILVESTLLPPTTVDFSGAIASARDGGAEVVIIGAPEGFAAGLIRQTVAAGWTPTWGYHGGFAASTFGAKLSGQASRMVMTDTTHAALAGKSKRGRVFNEAFRARFRRLPTANELSGAEAAGILIAGIRVGRSTNGARIATAIRGMQYRGMTFLRRWTGEGNLGSHVVAPVVQWVENGTQLRVVVSDANPRVREAP